VTVTPLESGFAEDPLFLPCLQDLAKAQLNAVPLISVFIDKKPTTPSIFTETKTTCRTPYDEARLRNGMPSFASPAGKLSEILLHNPSALVMETSIFNLALRRGTKWLTPSTLTGCLPGVTRRWLLENNRIEEDKDSLLTVDAVQHGELVLLFNGVQGCRLGTIVKS